MFQELSVHDYILFGLQFFQWHTDVNYDGKLAIPVFTRNGSVTVPPKGTLVLMQDQDSVSK